MHYIGEKLLDSHDLDARAKVLKLDGIIDPNKSLLHFHSDRMRKTVYAEDATVVFGGLTPNQELVSFS